MPARILVAEDQYSIRAFARTVLTGAGYDVAVAVNGAEAVAAVRDARFDLLLMDVHMPVMDGLTAVRLIRAIKGPMSKVPVIAMSGDGQAGMSEGMTDHICKPFRKAGLLLKVAARLDVELARPPAALLTESERTVFAEACELMGYPWAVHGLTKLKVQIDETFGAHPARSKGQLASQAHMLVPLAAILGFPALSDLCCKVEEACRNGYGVRPLFETAKAEASKARSSATSLIAAIESARVK